MLITAIDMVVSWVGASVLYLKCPSLFPAMAKAQGRKMEVTKYSIPLGLMFAVSLYASHQAYLYCSVTFLHFVKEANTVLIFWLSDPEGLQVSSSHTGGGGGFCLPPAFEFTGTATTTAQISSQQAKHQPPARQ